MGRQRLLALKNPASEIALAKQVGVKPDIFIWLQGEKEPVLGTSGQEYFNALDSLISNLDATPAPQWYLFQTSRCPGALRENGSREILAAQRRLSETRRNVHLVMNTDALDDSHRFDGCHFNARGQSAILDRLVPLIAAQVQAP